MSESNPCELTDIEQRLLCVALIGVGMRQGVETYEHIDAVARKLGISTMMKGALVSFVGFGQTLAAEIAAAEKAHQN